MIKHASFKFQSLVITVTFVHFRPVCVFFLKLKLANFPQHLCTFAAWCIQGIFTRFGVGFPTL